MRDNNMICFIELKGNFDDSQVKEIFDIAAETYDLKKCILQSFEFDNLLKARALFPDLPLMLTYGSGDTGYERCFDYGISIDADYQVITEEMVKEFHDRGLEVGLWTANDIFSMSYCKSLGVDYIESDNFSK
jgi:glycerophosphoryl diester phosphodiesterase